MTLDLPRRFPWPTLLSVCIMVLLWRVCSIPRYIRLLNYRACAANFCHDGCACGSRTATAVQPPPEPVVEPEPEPEPIPNRQKKHRWSLKSRSRNLSQTEAGEKGTGTAKTRCQTRRVRPASPFENTAPARPTSSTATLQPASRLPVWLQDHAH